MKTLVKQLWLESEAGWGQSDDGYSLHISSEECQRYIKVYWEMEKKLNPSGETPEIYSRPDGSPTLIEVDTKTYNKVKKVGSVRHYS